MQNSDNKEKEITLEEYKLQRYNDREASRYKREIKDRLLEIGNTVIDNNTDERVLKIYQEIAQRIVAFYRIKDKKKFFFLWELISKDYLENKKNHNRKNLNYYGGG